MGGDDHPLNLVGDVYKRQVFVSVGRQPATALVVGQLALDGGGYIVAGETTETSIPGVYAVGDVRTKPCLLYTSDVYKRQL